MPQKAYKIITNSFSVFILAVFFISCAHKPNIIGKWQEPGKTSSIEFSQDGTFTAIDDMGMAVSGNYTLQAKGKIRFEIEHPNSSVEIIAGSLSIQGDKLILTREGEQEILTYKKID